jgi:hypothetical protein
MASGEASGERRSVSPPVTSNNPLTWGYRGAHASPLAYRMKIMDPSPTIPLSVIAHGRSGDKGIHANIAVIAYTPAGYAWLRERMTAEVVRDYFAALRPSRVVRYEAPNLLALNFVLYDVLAGGASQSLRIDTQGKTLALALLQMAFPRPDHFTAMLRPAKVEP